ncbi:MAG TPA: hypothetical protein PKN59_11555, partial [Syntrophales bacterium]|nr:hypothetical protein [Syntrophales bacterium]
MRSCIPLRGLVCFSLLTWILLATLPPPAAFSAADGARIEMFAPQGTVKEIRQVTARFSEPMVSF